MQIIHLTSQGVSWQLRGTSEGVEVFRCRRACFRELQKTTHTEGTVQLMFPKDEGRRAHC